MSSGCWLRSSLSHTLISEAIVDGDEDVEALGKIKARLSFDV